MWNEGDIIRTHPGYRVWGCLDVKTLSIHYTLEAPIIVNQLSVLSPHSTTVSCYDGKKPSLIIPTKLCRQFIRSGPINQVVSTPTTNSTCNQLQRLDFGKHNPSGKIFLIKYYSCCKRSQKRYTSLSLDGNSCRIWMCTFAILPVLNFQKSWVRPPKITRFFKLIHLGFFSNENCFLVLEPLTIIFSRFSAQPKG